MLKADKSTTFFIENPLLREGKKNKILMQSFNFILSLTGVTMLQTLTKSEQSVDVLIKDIKTDKE